MGKIGRHAKGLQLHKLMFQMYISSSYLMSFMLTETMIGIHVFTLQSQNNIMILCTIAGCKAYVRDSLVRPLKKT